MGGKKRKRVNPYLFLLLRELIELEVFHVMHSRDIDMICGYLYSNIVRGIKGFENSSYHQKEGREITAYKFVRDLKNIFWLNVDDYSFTQHMLNRLAQQVTFFGIFRGWSHFANYYSLDYGAIECEKFSSKSFLDLPSQVVHTVKCWVDNRIQIYRNILIENSSIKPKELRARISKLNCNYTLRFATKEDLLNPFCLNNLEETPLWFMSSSNDICTPYVVYENEFSEIITVLAVEKANTVEFRNGDFKRRIQNWGNYFYNEDNIKDSKNLPSVNIQGLFEFLSGKCYRFNNSLEDIISQVCDCDSLVKVRTLSNNPNFFNDDLVIDFKFKRLENINAHTKGELPLYEYIIDWEILRDQLKCSYLLYT
ncbi:MAG: hypothetical protein JST82_09415 [Bacteroidetes bacterium]|nr:hypothetical protein [Bacteroidota bacterium]